jgi:hypothetical protein
MDRRIANSTPVSRDTEGASAAAERRMLGGWTLAQGWRREELPKHLDLSARDAQAGRTVLSSAALAGDIEGMALIIKGSDLEARDSDGATALMLAARSNCAQAARVLLACGSDPLARDKAGWTALMHASAVGDSATVSELAKACDPLAVAGDGLTALDMARNRTGPIGAAIVALLQPPSAPAAAERARRRGCAPVGSAAADHGARAVASEPDDKAKRKSAHMLMHRETNGAHGFGDR